MLAYHVAEHPPGLSLICISAKPPTAPRNLFPDHYTEAVAQVEHEVGLLIVPQTDEVGAHVLDHLHLLADDIRSHCSTCTCMVLMTVRAPEQKPLPVENERAFLLEQYGPETGP